MTGRTTTRPPGDDDEFEPSDEDDTWWDSRPRWVVDPLGTYTWFHGTDEYGIRLYVDRIAKSSAKSPGSKLRSVQRFAALLLKVALHEAHHLVEELALTEVELSLGPSPQPLFRRWMERCRKRDASTKINEGLANADALDRCYWIVRGRGNEHLGSYASRGLRGDIGLGMEVDSYLRGFVSRQSGWYRRAPALRRVGPVPKSTMTPPTWDPGLPRHRGNEPQPVDGSDYWMGVGHWWARQVLPLLKKPAKLLNGDHPILEGNLGNLLEAARSRYEVCDHELRIHLVGPDAPALKRVLGYCAKENLKLR